MAAYPVSISPVTSVQDSISTANPTLPKQLACDPFCSPVPISGLYIGLDILYGSVIGNNILNELALLLGVNATLMSVFALGLVTSVFVVNLAKLVLTIVTATVLVSPL